MEKMLEAEREEQPGVWQEGSKGLSYSYGDVNASINSGTQPALPMDQRGSRRMMKRKVLRHRPDGRVEVSDESLNIQPDTNAAKPWSLGHSRSPLDDTISKRKIETSSSALKNYLHSGDDDDLFPEDSPYSLRGDFGSDTISEYSFPERQPTNFIALYSDKQKRTDRVARFREHTQDWARYSFPGEDSHQDVRWAMRKQMLQSGLPRRPQKSLVPNTYVVPTMKKRDSLRFGVHWDLIHRVMPRRSSSS